MHILLLLLGFYRRISKDLLANYSVTYSAIDTKGINYSYIKILHLAFLHCAGPETDHVTHTLNSSTQEHTDHFISGTKVKTSTHQKYSWNIELGI